MKNEKWDPHVLQFFFFFERACAVNLKIVIEVVLFDWSYIDVEFQPHWREMILKIY